MTKDETRLCWMDPICLSIVGSIELGEIAREFHCP